MYVHAIYFDRWNPPEPVAMAAGWARELGWKYQQGLWMGSTFLPVPQSGPIWMLDEPRQAPTETRILLGLLRFIGGKRVKVSTRMTLMEMDQACRKLQQMGLPIDPYFVLEREIHVLSGLGGKFLLEVPVGKDPQEIAQQRGLHGRRLEGQIPSLPPIAQPCPGRLGVYKISV